MATIYRQELKFLIDQPQKILLEQRLKAFLNFDHHSGAQQSYQITSLYFDDYQLNAYFDKINGASRRTKYRLRTYNFDPNFIRLEAKVKHGVSMSKTSTQIPRLAYHQLLAGHPDWTTALDVKTSNSALIQAFTFAQKINLLQPKIMIDYQRTTLTDEQHDLRLAFDENLQATTSLTDFFAYSQSDTKAFFQSILPAGQIIFEVKYHHYLPALITELLNSLPLHRLALSKYVLCQQKLRNQFQIN